MIKKDLMTINLTGHGTFETTPDALERMIDRYWDYSSRNLRNEIQELSGDPGYEVSDLTRIACIMILAELNGFATN